MVQMIFQISIFRSFFFFRFSLAAVKKIKTGREENPSRKTHRPTRLLFQFRDVILIPRRLGLEIPDLEFPPLVFRGDCMLVSGYPYDMYLICIFMYLHVSLCTYMSMCKYRLNMGCYHWLPMTVQPSGRPNKNK